MTLQARMLGAGLDRPVDWQPSRFLADRAEAECIFVLAERSAPTPPFRSRHDLAFLRKRIAPTSPTPRKGSWRLMPADPARPTD
jgi:hypothetical protein